MHGHLNIKFVVACSWSHIYLLFKYARSLEHKVCCKFLSMLGLMVAVKVTGTKGCSVGATQYYCQIRYRVLLIARATSALCDMVYVPIPMPCPLNFL